MKRKCLTCGTEFSTYPSVIKMGKGKYCCKACGFIGQLGKCVSPATTFKKGMKPSNFKGIQYTKARANSGSYKLIYMPEHPNCTKKGYVREHRLVMEKHLGRYLLSNEIVHHIDGDTLNNNIINLELLSKHDHDKMNVVLNVHRRWQK